MEGETFYFELVGESTKYDEVPNFFFLNKETYILTRKGKLICEYS